MNAMAGGLLEKNKEKQYQKMYSPMTTAKLNILSRTPMAEEMSCMLIARSLRSFPALMINISISSRLTSPLSSRSRIWNTSSASSRRSAPSTSTRSCWNSASWPAPAKDSQSRRASAFDARSVSRALSTMEWALVVENSCWPVTSEAIAPMLRSPCRGLGACR